MLAKNQSPVKLTGIWGSASCAVSAALNAKTQRTVLFVVNHLDDADAACDDFEMFTGQVAHQFPAWEAQLANDKISDEITGERLAILNELIEMTSPESRNSSAPPKPKLRFLVAPVMALLQPVPTKRALENSRKQLAIGDTLEPSELAAWLVDNGYESVAQVDAQGEFAQRGGIVDLMGPGDKLATRIEFFGDEIDSIRQFDLDTQRSIESTDQISIVSLSVSRSLNATSEKNSSQTTNLLSYLPADTLICTTEPGETRDLADQLYDRIRDDLVDENSPVSLRKVDEIFSGMENFSQVQMYLFSSAKPGDSVKLGVRSLERLSINTAEALDELADLAKVSRVWIFCDNEAERQRFSEHIAEHHKLLAKNATLKIGHLSSGFNWPALKLVAVGHHEIYQRYNKVRKIRRVRTGRAIQSMVDLSAGDYVVHVGHGIAKFEGLHRLERDGTNEEYLKLKFADNAVLHVQASQINLVQKYIGSKGHRPTLSKLGGGHWARAKQRVTEAVKDLAADMLRMQAMREATPGFSYPRTTKLQKQFADEFLYTETEDQLSAIGQIDSDMEKQRPMDRLICGDVGYGKTEIAMRAAMKIVEAGRQVAVLVPTTVLADQHWRNFTERFADFPIFVDMLSRFRTPKQQRETIKKLSLGQVDILIGTHRLLSKDVKFPDLGLVIIDEEQRFGVAAKEHLKSLRATLDVLTLTATPIPRTLHMSLLGLRDISSLQTPPMDRRSIQTEVCPFDKDLIKSAIIRELNRDGQVYFVHNRVESIYAIARQIQDLVPDAKIKVGHGQMPERELEKVMKSFTRGFIDVLVSTTIIESGIDIPTANTMIINDADRFGLSALHQLRGRVGRYKHRAYCYLLLPTTRTVNPVAAKRLKAIEDFSDLGAGFQIAMRDLEIRGAGNILGSQQSGHIASVGYELYCQLLEQTVHQLRGKKPPREISVHVDLGIEAFIPRSYVPSDRQRMEIYRQLVFCDKVSRVDQLRADLIDAFGPLPAKVELLLDVSMLRVHAHNLEIDAVILAAQDIIFKVRDPKKLDKILTGAPGSVRMPDQSSVYWRPPENYLQMPSLLRILINRLDPDSQARNRAKQIETELNDAKAASEKPANAPQKKATANRDLNPPKRRFRTGAKPLKPMQKKPRVRKKPKSSSRKLIEQLRKKNREN